MEDAVDLVVEKELALGDLERSILRDGRRSSCMLEICRSRLPRRVSGVCSSSMGLLRIAFCQRIVIRDVSGDLHS